MSNLVRFGISLPIDLLKKFDYFLKKKNYSNRSEGIRDLIRQELVKEEWNKEEGEVVGAITLIYDHHKRTLLNKIIDLQHNFQKVIISSQHIHLDHDNCLEIVAVKGLPKEIKRLADRLKALKGVKHTSLSMSTTGKDLV